MTLFSRFLILSLLVLAGCATTERAALHVGIAGIAIKGASIQGGSAEITLELTNEALFPIVVEEDMHKVYLDDVLVGQGSGSGAFALPSLGRVTRVVTIVLGDAAAAERISNTLAKGGANYRVESRLITNTYDNKSVIKNTSSGSFSVADR